MSLEEENARLIAENGELRASVVRAELAENVAAVRLVKAERLLVDALDEIEAGHAALRMGADEAADGCIDGIRAFLQSRPANAPTSEVEKYKVCDWPLASEVRDGCVRGNCSYRPERGSDEYRRIEARRLALIANLDSSSAGLTVSTGTHDLKHPVANAPGDESKQWLIPGESFASPNSPSAPSQDGVSSVVGGPSTETQTAGVSNTVADGVCCIIDCECRCHNISNQAVRDCPDCTGRTASEGGAK